MEEQLEGKEKILKIKDMSLERKAKTTHILVLLTAVLYMNVKGGQRKKLIGGKNKFIQNVVASGDLDGYHGLLEREISTC